MEGNCSTTEHMLRLSGYYNRLNQMGVNPPNKIVIDRVIYSMQRMTKTIPELFAMLKSTKVEIKKEHQVLMIDKTTSFKKKAKGKKGDFM